MLRSDDGPLRNSDEFADRRAGGHSYSHARRDSDFLRGQRASTVVVSPPRGVNSPLQVAPDRFYRGHNILQHPVHGILEEFDLFAIPKQIHLQRFKFEAKLFGVPYSIVIAP